MLRTGLILAAILFCLAGRSAVACEEFQAIDLDQAQELLTKLKDPQADTMDRVFAFNALACSTIPAVRQVAMKEALKIDDPIVQAQVLEEILMQRDAIIVELIPPADLPRNAKQWVDGLNGSFIYQFGLKDPRAGCISINYYSGDECRKGSMIKLNGDTVDVYEGALFGEFTLQPDQTLRGYIKPANNMPAIPAKIGLF
jgi:hypothetical protein